MLDTALSLSRRPLEARLRAEGYRYEPVAPVADITAAVDAGCGWCCCQGAVEVRPFWKGPELRLVVVCHECRYTEER